MEKKIKARFFEENSNVWVEFKSLIEGLRLVTTKDYKITTLSKEKEEVEYSYFTDIKSFFEILKLSKIEKGEVLFEENLDEFYFFKGENRDFSSKEITKEFIDNYISNNYPSLLRVDISFKYLSIVDLMTNTDYGFAFNSDITTKEIDLINSYLNQTV